jgi:hypothetical protein
MKQVTKLVLLACLVSCASGTSEIVILQKGERRPAKEQSSEILIKREKQSLKIAMLRLEFEKRIHTTIIAEANALVYKSDHGLDAILLPEVVKLFSLALRRSMTIYVISSQQQKLHLVKDLLHNGPFSKKEHKRFKFVKTESVVPFKKLSPTLILAESYDKLWPKKLSSSVTAQKTKWYKEWVPMPNYKRDEISSKELSALLKLKL